MSDTSRLFVVARVSWHAQTCWGETDIDQDDRNTPGDGRRFVPVEAFAERDAAEARAWELEQEAARLFNPFVRFGSLDYLTSLPEVEFRRKFGELVGPLPDSPLDSDGRTRHWRLWWDEYSPSWSDETLAKVWELFDKIRFYAILEVEAE